MPAAEISFNFTPEEALEYFRRREEKKVSWSYKDVWQEEHKRAFTVAKLTKASLLNDVQQSLDKALAEGKSFEQWRTEILQKLDKVWLGKTYGELWDEMSPEEQEKHEEPTEDERKRVISESRLTTIFRTNMFSSYQSGRYRQLVDDVEDYPYWRYVTMEDEAVRPLHAALHGKVFRWDDPFWDTHYPPNGYNCRCEVEGLDDFDLEAQGLTLEEGAMFTLKEPDGTERAAYRDADGKTYPCDKGWSYNVGKEDGLRRVIEDKDLPEQLRLQLDWDLQQFDEQAKAVAETVKAEAKAAVDKAKAAPKAAEPQTVKPAAQPAVKPAAQPSAEPAEETPPSDAKPKKSRKPKADKLQEQEQAILRDMERQNKELEKLYQQLDTPLPEPPEEPALEAVKAENAPAAADARPVKQAEKEVKPLKAADTNNKKEAKKAKKLKKKTASGSKRRADEAPKKVKKAKVKDEEQAAEIELPPVKSEAAAEGPQYVDTPIPAKGTETEPLREGLSFLPIKRNMPPVKEKVKAHIEAGIKRNFDKEKLPATFKEAIAAAEEIAKEDAEKRKVRLYKDQLGDAVDSIPIYFDNVKDFTVEKFEKYIETQTIEYAVAITKDGIPLVGAIGGANYVNLYSAMRKYSHETGIPLETLMDQMEGGTVIHNHTRGDSTFSTNDLVTYAYRWRLGELKAIAQKSNYVFLPNLKFKRLNIENFINSLEIMFCDAEILLAISTVHIACRFAHNELKNALKGYGIYKRVKRKNKNH